VVRWKGKGYDGKLYDNDYQQTWTVHVEQGKFVIQKYLVTQVGLVEVASSIRQWTGIAISNEGRIFVNYPRWSDNVPISVAEWIDGEVKPYPNLEMNLWNPQDSPKEHFVCVQSVFVDDANNLWILDPANPQFKGVVAGGPKLFKVNLTTNAIERTYFFDNTIAPENSYLNDMRIDTKKELAYISESGEGAIIVLDLKTGKARRLLSGHFSTQSQEITLTIEGQKWLLSGKEPRVHCDGIALSPDAGYLYYQSLTSRSLYRIATQWLQKEDTADLEEKVEFVCSSGAADGLIFDKQGNLYLSSLEHNAIRRLGSDNILEVIAKDSRISWPDSFAFFQGTLYFTTSQIHLGGKISNPYKIFKILPLKNVK
jgi:sugar lactone lactonase YvrE